MNHIHVNGTAYEVKDEELELSLLEYLRERRFLSGTKNACEKGLCGSCTVVIDGKAMRSCKTPLKKALGSEVVTIEGMEDSTGELHPIQKAFIDAGAIQCGFCTPGMVMASYALLLHNAEPDRDAIRKALRGNLCRCTGYQQIVDAVEMAAKNIKEQALPIKAGSLRDEEDFD